MNLRSKPANANRAAATGGPSASARNPRLLEWLARLTQPGLELDLLAQPYDVDDHRSALPAEELPHSEDWHAVAQICGYSAQDFIESATKLPLSAAEIEHFRRNHRGTETHVSRDFLTAQSELPSPLAEMYGLYMHRARADAEAALFLAQSTGSIRVARVMADLLAIGAFANGSECISYLGITYSVPAAFDTARQIDRANQEALRRLALPADHPSHLLKLAPEDIGILAASIAERNLMASADFLEKANLLAEARQDVNRLPAADRFATALRERDLPMTLPWMDRLAVAYMRVFPKWVNHLPEIQALLS